MTGKIKLFWMGVAVMAVLAGVSAYLSRTQPREISKTMNVRLELQSGESRSLSDLVSAQKNENAFIVVHFWAAWCPPCLTEIQAFLDSAQNHADKSLIFAIVSSDKNWADAQKVVPKEKLPANVTSFLDSSAKLAESFGTFQYPETYLLTRDGKVLHKWVGPQNWAGIDLNNFVRSLVK